MVKDVYNVQSQSIGRFVAYLNIVLLQCSDLNLSPMFPVPNEGGERFARPLDSDYSEFDVYSSQDIAVCESKPAVEYPHTPRLEIDLGGDSSVESTFSPFEHSSTSRSSIPDMRTVEHMKVTPPSCSAKKETPVRVRIPPFSETYSEFTSSNPLKRRENMGSLNLTHTVKKPRKDHSSKIKGAKGRMNTEHGEDELQNKGQGSPVHQRDVEGIATPSTYSPHTSGILIFIPDSTHTGSTTTGEHHLGVQPQPPHCSATRVSPSFTPPQIGPMQNSLEMFHGVPVYSLQVPRPSPPLVQTDIHRRESPVELGAGMYRHFNPEHMRVEPEQSFPKGSLPDIPAPRIPHGPGYVQPHEVDTIQRAVYKCLSAQKYVPLNREQNPVPPLATVDRECSVDSFAYLGSLVLQSGDGRQKECTPVLNERVHGTHVSTGKRSQQAAPSSDQPGRVENELAVEGRGVCGRNDDPDIEIIEPNINPRIKDKHTLDMTFDKRFKHDATLTALPGRDGNERSAVGGSCSANGSSGEYGGKEDSDVEIIDP